MATQKPTNVREWAETGSKVDPGDLKYGNGWVVEIPPMQTMNYLQNQITKFIKHVNEEGIPVWDSGTNYPDGAICKGTDGILYQSLRQTDGDEPQSSPVDWEEYKGSSKDFTPLLEVDLAYTIGIGGDFASINEALAAMSVYHPIFNSPIGIKVTLTMLTGFVINEEVHVDGINLGWIELTSAQGRTPHIMVSSALVTDMYDGVRCFFGVKNNGTMPTINFFSRFDITNSGTNKFGFVAAGGTIPALDIGCQQAGNSGIAAFHGGLVLADGVINCIQCKNAGLLATHGATISCPGDINVTQCEFAGILSLSGSYIGTNDLLQASNSFNGVVVESAGRVGAGSIEANDCIEAGVRCFTGGTVATPGDITANNADYGIWSQGGLVRGLNLTCNNTIKDGIYVYGGGGSVDATKDISAINAGAIGVHAVVGSITAVGTIDASGATTFGVKTTGGTIAAVIIIGSNAGKNGLDATGGGSISASGIVADGCTEAGAHVEQGGASIASLANMTCDDCGYAGVICYKGGNVGVGGRLQCLRGGSYGVFSGGGVISALEMATLRGVTNSSTDTFVHLGGMVTRQVNVSGGTNNTPGLFNFNGYVNL